MGNRTGDGPDLGRDQRADRDQARHHVDRGFRRAAGAKPGGLWINSKYEDKQSTHYSFEMSCGNGGRRLSSRSRYGGFQAFGPKAQFADLFGYTIDGGQPVELVAVTDRSHENERTYPLLSWQPR